MPYGTNCLQKKKVYNELTVFRYSSAEAILRCHEPYTETCSPFCSLRASVVSSLSIFSNAHAPTSVKVYVSALCAYRLCDRSLNTPERWGFGALISSHSLYSEENVPQERKPLPNAIAPIRRGYIFHAPFEPKLYITFLSARNCCEGGWVRKRRCKRGTGAARRRSYF